MKFSLRDKQLFEISEFEIARVNCNFIPASIFRDKFPLVKCDGSNLSLLMHN